jgi:hypothetical protein
MYRISAASTTPIPNGRAARQASNTVSTNSGTFDFPPRRTIACADLTARPTINLIRRSNGGRV